MKLSSSLIVAVILSTVLIVSTLSRDNIHVSINPDHKMDIAKNFGAKQAVRNYTIPGSFLAFSIEVSSMMYYLDQKEAKPKRWFVQLLKNLKELTGYAPTIRIGGNSADWSWYNPSRRPRPQYIVYDTDINYFVSLKELAKEMEMQFMFGVNFLSGYDPSYALEEVKAISQFLGWEYIRAIQLGNEPDVYGGHYRAPGYTFAQYKVESAKYRSAIRSTDTRIPYDIFSGPDFCCPGGKYYLNGPDFVATQTKEYNSYGFHIYPLSACGGGKPTMQQLLSDHSVSIKNLTVFRDIAKTADEHNKEWIISETNNICCEGYPGVSNTFASAVWALDFMFSAASIGPNAIHFHASGFSYYTAIQIDKTGERPNYYKIMPMYYAWLMFNTAIGRGSTLLDLSVKTSNPFIKAWAVIDNQDETLRVMIIQKDLNTMVESDIEIQIEKATLYDSVGEMYVLKGADMYDNSTVTFAGQSFENTTDGKPRGDKVTHRVSGVDGVFKLQLPPASAILLVIKRK
jgi:hypothetical protein